MSSVEDGVWNEQLASSSSGAFPVEISPDVRRTADTSVILAHASTEPHASVARRLHQDQLIGTGTTRVEHLPLTVLYQR